MLIYALIISFISIVGSIYFAIDTYNEVKTKQCIFWCLASVYSIFFNLLFLTFLLGGN